MSENHPSKPIRKAGPTTGELVLDRGLALHLLDQMDASPLRLLYALYGGGHRKSR